MADRVELQVIVNGGKEAEQNLESLKRLQQELGKKTVIDADISHFKSEMAEAQRLVNSFRQDMAKALQRGDTSAYFSAKKDLADASAYARELTNHYNASVREAASLHSQQKDVTEAIKSQESYLKQAASETKSVAAEQNKVATEAKSAANAVKEDWQERAKSVHEAVRQAAEAARTARETEQAAKAAEEQRYATQYAAMEERNKADAARMAAAEIGRQEDLARRTAAEEAAAAEEAERMAEAAARSEARFQAVLSAVDGIVSALNSAASISDAIGGFGNFLVGGISGSGDLFNFSILDKAMDTITSMITQYATGNLDRITSRYDIMNTFDQYMALMGVPQAAANRSMERINESILGLPIGLDEAMYRLRRYQMFMGDIDRATDFTIGIQRAIMAGGANEQMRNMSYNQIERLLTTGELTTKRQWMSLLNGLGVSIQFIAEELGYADMNGKELAGALYSGKISADEFLGAITSLGKGTSAAALRLNDALDIYKGTIESWASNIEFAFIRGGANTLATVDQMLMVETGVSMTGYMEKFRDAVNQAYKDIQAWIDENPQVVNLSFDVLDNLKESMEGFSLGDVAEKSLEYTANFLNAIANAIAKIDKDKAESFIAFALSIGKPFATVAKYSSQMGFVLGVVERFEDHDWNNFFGHLFDAVSGVANLTSGFLDIFSDDLLDRIMVFALVYAPMIRGAVDAITNAWNMLKPALSGVKSVWDASVGALGVGGTLLGFGTIAVAIGAVTWAIQQFNKQKLEAKKVFNIDQLDEEISKTNGLISQIHQTTEEHEANLAKISEQRDRAEELLNKIDALNEKVKGGDKTSVPILAAAVDQFNRLFPELKIGLDETTGALDSNSEAVAKNATAYANAIQSVREYQAAQSYLETLTAQRFELRLHIQNLKANRDSYHDQIETILREGGYYAVDTGNWWTQFWYDMANGLDQLTSGDNAKLKVLGDAYEKADAELAVAMTELDNMNLTMQQASEAADEYSDQVAQSAEASDMLADAQRNAAESTNATTNAFQAQEEALDALIEKYEAFKEAAYDSLHSAIASFDEIKAKDDYDFDAVMKNNAEKMAGYRAATELMSDALANAAMNGNDYGLMATYFSDLMSSGNFDAVVQAGERIAAGLLQEDLDTYAQMLGEIDPAAANQALVQALNENRQAAMVGIFSGDIPVYGEAWAQLMEQYNSDLNSLIEKYGYNPATGGFSGVDVDNWEESLEELNEFTLKYFGNGEDSEDGTATQAFEYLNELMKTMQEDSIPELGDAYTELGNLVDEFTGQRLVPLVQEHSNAKTEADNQKQATENLANLLQERGGDFTTFADQLNNVASAAGEAASQLQAVAAAIGAIPEMPSLTGALDNNLGAAFGDAVYRASGGPIGGTYRGYDSVPAMLTPGEFVIRRKAAQMLGRGFLDSINSLNIPAAVDSLMRSVNLPQSRIVAYDNRRTYDNHAQVIQNINTNNAAFTYRRASRFVGAL